MSRGGATQEPVCHANQRINTVLEAAVILRTLVGAAMQLVDAAAGTAGRAEGGDPSFVIKYPEGEKTIIVPASAHVARYVVGSKDDLKPGAPFRIQTAARQPDGTYTATSISVGKDGGLPF